MLDVLNLSFHLGDKNTVWQKEHRCLYIVSQRDGSRRCNMLFVNANQLKEHRDQAGHRQKRKKNVAVNTPGKKQIRLDDLMERAPNNLEVEEKSDVCALCKFY